MADFWMEDEHYQMKGAPDNVKVNQLNSLLIESLLATGQVERCALINKKEMEVQAFSPGYKLGKDQIRLLVDGFKNSLMLRKEGLFFDSRNYRVIRADKYSIYAKSLYEEQESGLVAARTSTFVLVAKYTQPMYPAVCIEAVEKLAEYLREKGR